MYIICRYICIHVYQCRVFTVLSPFFLGPPIQIIPDYRTREEGDTDIDKQQLQLEDEEGEDGEEVDKAFATVLEDAGIGDSISTYWSTMHVRIHVQLWKLVGRNILQENFRGWL